MYRGQFVKTRRMAGQRQPDTSGRTLDFSANRAQEYREQTKITWNSKLPGPFPLHICPLSTSIPALDKSRRLRAVCGLTTLRSLQIPTKLTSLMQHRHTAALAWVCMQGAASQQCPVSYLIYVLYFWVKTWKKCHVYHVLFRHSA